MQSELITLTLAGAEWRASFNTNDLKGLSSIHLSAHRSKTTHRREPSKDIPHILIAIDLKKKYYHERNWATHAEKITIVEPSSGAP